MYPIAVQVLRSLSTISLVLATTIGAVAQSIPFQGKLTDNSSVPLNGVFDLQFQLYDDLSSGSPVGPELAINDTTLADGFVNAGLNFGDVFAAGDIWLEVRVRPGPSGGAFEAISPRTPILWSPRATSAARMGQLIAFETSPWDAINFRSPYDLRFHLDDDNDDTLEWFSVFNGDDNALLTLTESGELIAIEGSGDGSVQFPSGSISATETLQEAGLVSTSVNSVTVSPGATATIATASINTPSSGYILAMASANMITGAGSAGSLAISKDVEAMGSDTLDYSFANAFSAPITHHEVFLAGSENTYTFYFIAKVYSSGGGAGFYLPRLSLMFFPTEYGTVTPNSASLGKQAGIVAKGLTRADIDAERAASIDANQRRIQRELDEVKAQLEALQAKVAKNAER